MSSKGTRWLIVCTAFAITFWALLVIALARGAAPPPWLCNSISGTFRAEVLIGTAECDLISAAGGDDIIHGRGHGDRLYGERGGDAVYGEGGSDLLLAGCERNTCDPGRYGNWLIGGPGDDILGAENGYKDYLYGGDGRDICYVDGRDVVRGCEVRR